jgi:hypothetical protein
MSTARVKEKASGGDIQSIVGMHRSHSDLALLCRKGREAQFRSLASNPRDKAYLLARLNTDKAKANGETL